MADAATPLITRRFDACVCQADTLELDVPTPLRLEANNVYAIRQWGSTSTAVVVVYIEQGGMLHALTETAVVGADGESAYENSTYAPGLVVSYHVRNADGSTVRGTRTSYTSTVLTAGGAGYLRIALPSSLPSGHRIILRTSNPASNFVRVDLVDACSRVRTGDYLWLEVEQQTRVTGTGWVDAYEATETSAATERIALSIDLQQDQSLPEEDMF